jgi:hypothetical protein
VEQEVEQEKILVPLGRQKWTDRWNKVEQDKQKVEQEKILVPPI